MLRKEGKGVKMDFQRARTKKQIEERQLDIMNACDTLFDEGDYENVNIKAISAITTLTRSSIYTYYKTKDEILLDILGYELADWKEELLVWCQETAPLDAEEFSRQFMNTILKREKMVKHYCLLFTLLERNSRLEKLVEFKQKAIPTAGAVVQCVRMNFPNYSQREASSIAEQIIALVIGLYPVAHLTQNQKEAIAISKTGYIEPDFESTCRKGISALVKKGTRNT